ncbi:MAG: hypothetical protein GDA44_06835 [Prochloron sp. SP5CPC1]|nr:hypothetical protein [Candidatus Paraprochloron terpiosi SP5CPC1]
MLKDSLPDVLSKNSFVDKTVVDEIEGPVEGVIEAELDVTGSKSDRNSLTNQLPLVRIKKTNPVTSKGLDLSSFTAVTLLQQVISNPDEGCRIRPQMDAKRKCQSE